MEEKVELDDNGYIIEPEEKDQTPESSYFLIVTFAVISDNRLNDFQKLMFAAITGLCRQKGYCWATNKYFEKLFNRKETQVSQAISALVEFGYLSREIVFKRKVEKDGKITKTKQIALRKLRVLITTPIPENQTRGIPENQNLIDNNIINNLSIKDISKDISLNSATEATEEDILNNNYLGKDGNSVDLDTSDDLVIIPIDTAPVEKPKRKQGVNIAPYIDAIDDYFKGIPDIKKALTNYIICVNSCRAIWTMEEWKQLLIDLQKAHNVILPGASGSKLMINGVLKDIEFAIRGNGREPYMDFGEYKEKEPQFNLNQEFKDS